MNVSEVWRSIFRVGVGLFWLYFASQKWTMGVAWMRPLIERAPAVNPIPGLHEFLALVVAPNWFLFALLQTAGESIAAVLLVLGLASRKAAVLGFLLALNLALTVAFETGDIGSRWLHSRAARATAVLFSEEPGRLSRGGLSGARPPP